MNIRILVPVFGLLLVMSTYSRADDGDKELISALVADWQSEVVSTDSWPEWFINFEPVGQYSKVLANLDLDQAIDFHRKLRSHNFNKETLVDRSSIYRDLISRLIAEHRFEEAVSLAGKANISQYQFWVHAAEYGIAEQDEEVFEFAAAQIDAMGEQERRGRKDEEFDPSVELSTARFFIAAGRLDLLRDKPDSGAQQIAQLNRMSRAYGSIPVVANTEFVNNFFSTSMDYWYVSGSFQNYISLESWIANEVLADARKEAGFDKGYDEDLEGIVDWKYYKVGRLDPPVVEAEGVTPWVHRKIHLGQHAAVVEYLARAKGDPLHHARLLAIVAASLAGDRPTHARACRDKAIELIESDLETNANVAARTELRIEAYAELAIAFHQQGLKKEAREYALVAVKTYSAHFEVPDANRMDDAFGPLLEVVSVCKLEVSLLPDDFVVRAKAWNTHRGDPSATYLYQRGVFRKVDISHVVPVVERMQDTENAEFLDAYYGQRWQEAFEIIKDNSKALEWYRHEISSIGAGSVDTHGLKKTLEWTALIDDDRLRMTLELGAALQALGNIEPPFPGELYSTPASLAPGVSWPWRNIGC